MSRFCPDCGTEIAAGMRFCSKCGQAVAEKAPGQPEGYGVSSPNDATGQGSFTDRSGTPDLPPAPQAGSPPGNIPPPPAQDTSGSGRRKWMVLGGGGCALVLGLGLLLILVLFLAAMCSSGGASDDSGGSDTVSAVNSQYENSEEGESSPTPSVDLEPGLAQGTVTTSAGEPLEGAKLYLTGLSTEAGSQVQANAETDSDGFYSIEVPDGEFEMSASYPIEDYEGQTWTNWELYPLDGEPMFSPFDGEDGLVRDFEWRLSGPIAGEDPDDAFSYYGAYIQLNYQEENTGATPQDTRFTFVLTPTVPLADGSEGGEITYERTFAQLGGYDDDSTLDTGGTLYDIPLGKYTLSGSIALPDGSEYPLQFDENFTDATESLEIVFEPDATSSRADLVQVNVYAEGSSAGQEDTYVEPWNQ